MGTKFGPIVKTSEELISASGGWSPIPAGGGIITFSGSAVLLGDHKYRVGEYYNIEKIGNFLISSISKSSSPDGVRTSLSLSCKIGWASKSGGSSGLGVCVQFGKDKYKPLPEIIKKLASLCGIPSFQVPSANGVQIKESIWLKEGQSAFSLLNEILTCRGLILYENEQNKIICEPLSDCLSAYLGGQDPPAGAVIIEKTATKNFSNVPSGALITGVYKTFTPLPEKKITSESSSLRQSVSNGKMAFYWVKTTTEVEISVVDRTIITTIEETCKEDPLLNTKKIIREEYEKKVKADLKADPVAYDVSKCYPDDKGRILRRTTRTFKNKAGLFEPVTKEFISSLGSNKINWETVYKFPEKLSGWRWYNILETETLEEWKYNTKKENITFGYEPTVPTAKIETIRYIKRENKVKAVLPMAWANTTGSTSPEFITSKNEAIIKAFADYFYYDCCESFDQLVLASIEEITWTKNPGVSKWQGSRRNDVLRIMIDPQMISSILGAFLHNCEVRLIMGERLYNQFVEKRDRLAIETLELMNAEHETKNDWSPSFQTFPAEQEVDEENWINRFPLQKEGAGGGGLINISAGRFASYHEAINSAINTYLLEKAKLKATTMTMLSPGEIIRPVISGVDSPSFSLDSNGLKVSGVFYE